MKRYNPKEIEPKWQANWQKSGIYQSSDNKAKTKKYILEYFPYPSGATMHVGHVRNYTIGDAISRFYRMSGYNVLHPMGWDAFGLPAENYAITTGISPRQAIDKNTKHFKEQLMQMGFGYDWTKEIDSTDPKYYKWTQWFFLLLFKRGLAYQQESLQWWCPKDKTVLANEQVEAGLCWRCGSVVEKKSLKQWFFKITEYADALDKDLDNVNWSDSIKTMQRNWIGRSVGAEIDFKVDGLDETVKVYTTRIDTIFGATFLVLAPENNLIKEIVTKDQQAKVNTYIKSVQSKSEIERQETNRQKTGVFSGSYAINPINKQKIPIWIADYVLSSYGTGAIMAVPAHDERDYEFAKKFDLSITQVIMPCEDDSKNPPRQGFEEVERDTVIVHLKNKATGKFALLDWHGSLSGITTAIMGGIDEGQTPETAAAMEILEEASIKNVNFVHSLQWITAARYCASHKKQNRKAITHVLLAEVDNLDEQGEISDEEKKLHTLVWVDEQEVYGRLVPDHQKMVWQQLRNETALDGEGELINSGQYDGMSSAIAREKITAHLAKTETIKERTNYKMRDWLISRQRYWGAPIPIIHCPKCGAMPVDEGQLPVLLPPMDKYEPGNDGKSPLANVADFVNTVCPKCGGPAKRETDTMDGFACSSWYFLRFPDVNDDKKPFDKSKIDFWLPVDDYIGGAEHAVLHLLYSRFWVKVMFDAGMVDFNEPFSTLRNHGMILAHDGVKMSKSKNNTINPDDLISQGYGADSIRIMELFIGPWNQVANWNTDGLGGTFRFLQRTWNIVSEFLDSKTKEDDIHDLELRRLINQNIKKTTEDLLNLSFNTAIAYQMECLNSLYKLKDQDKFSNRKTWSYVIKTMLQLLAPFAPHISEELWQEMGEKGSIHISQWPAYDPKFLVSDEMTIVVQINGKLVGEFSTKTDSSEEEIVACAKNLEKVVARLSGKEIKKSIYVKSRLVNFVV